MIHELPPCHADPSEDDQMEVQLFKAYAGRDLVEVDLVLEFDRDTGCWQSLGESGEAKSREAEKEILEVLAEMGKVQAIPISRTLGKDDSNTHKTIAKLSTEGKIKKEVLYGKFFYFLPPEKEK